MNILNELVEAFRGPNIFKNEYQVSMRGFWMDELSASGKSESRREMLSQTLDELIPLFMGYNALSFIICKETVVDHINLFQKICSVIIFVLPFRFRFLVRDLSMINA